MELSLRQQCKLLHIPRSSYYYPCCSQEIESSENIEIMNIMDKQYTTFPTSGVRTMRSVLDDKGFCANKKRIRRLMQKMGITAIYPQKSLSKLGKAEYIHPYLLRHLNIDHSNQVWSIDISYIALSKGFMYLVGIIDWHSRKLLSWKLTNTLDTSSSIECLHEVIRTHGKPEIINSDQGCQYTSKLWVETLKNEDIQISMDGKGRAKDNIRIERFWRSIKQEYIYLHPCDNGTELYKGIKWYIDYYNNKRHHQGINNAIPAQYYQQSLQKEAA